MSYKNIVFVKLEKRLFNDHRWYMMSEQSQLNYVRFMLFAAESYNKIPKNLDAIKRAFKTDQDLEMIKKSIEEIKLNFPKFKENKHFYYFDEFDSKTNYVAPKEILGKSRGTPKTATDIDIDIDKEKDKEEEKEKDGKSHTRLKKEISKKKFLEFVYLATEEHEKLVAKIGEAETSRYIQSLNDYIGSKGDKYKNHYHTLLVWIRKDGSSKPKRNLRVENEALEKINQWEKENAGIPQ